MANNGGLLRRRLTGGMRWLFVGYAVLAAFVLFAAVLNLVADPTFWWWWVLIGLGMAAIAVHPMTRTPLTWPDVPIDETETLVVAQRGSWVHGIARGGTLALTRDRLVFEPNSVEATLRLTTQTWDLTDITGVDIAPRGANLFGNSIRRRLRVHLRDGRRELFVLHDVEAMRSALTTTLTTAFTDRQKP